MKNKYWWNSKEFKFYQSRNFYCDTMILAGFIWALVLMVGCGQKTVDLNELETFFRGREVLFDNSLANNCQYTLVKTDNGLDVKHKLIVDYVEHYSFSDFEIIEKNALNEESKYFEIGRFRVIGQSNRTVMLLGNEPCYETFY